MSTTTLTKTSKTKAPKETGFEDSSTEYDFYSKRTPEKARNAEIIAKEARTLIQTHLDNTDGSQPFRIFEHGFGSGHNLIKILHTANDIAPKLPISITAKEFGANYIIQSLPDFAFAFQNPNFSLAITNGVVQNAVRLKRPSKKDHYIYNLELESNTDSGITEQLVTRLEPFVQSAWTTVKNQHGKHVPEVQGTIIISHKDRNRDIAPPPQISVAQDFNLATAIHPWQLGAESTRKAAIVASLAKSLSPMGKAFIIQAGGGTNCEEICQTLWPDEGTFSGFQDIIDAAQQKLGDRADQFTLETGTSIEFQSNTKLSTTGALRLAAYARQTPHELANAAYTDEGQLRKIDKILSRNEGRVTFANEMLVVTPKGAFE